MTHPMFMPEHMTKEECRFWRELLPALQAAMTPEEREQAATDHLWKHRRDEMRLRLKEDMVEIVRYGCRWRDLFSLSSLRFHKDGLRRVRGAA